MLNLLITICFQRLNDKLKNEGDQRTERTKQRLHQRFSLFIPNVDEDEESEDEGDEYTMDDISEGDSSSSQEKKSDSNAESASSNKPSSPVVAPVPLPRAKSSHSIQAPATSFHKRQISDPAGIPRLNQVKKKESKCDEIRKLDNIFN